MLWICWGGGGRNYFATPSMNVRINFSGVGIQTKGVGLILAKSDRVHVRGQLQVYCSSYRATGWPYTACTACTACHNLLFSNTLSVFSLMKVHMTIAGEIPIGVPPIVDWATGCPVITSYHLEVVIAVSMQERRDCIMHILL